MTFKAFQGMVGGLVDNGRAIGKALAHALEVPYHEDREAGGREHWPFSFNRVEEAVQKLPHGILGAYFHVPSLNLVLIGPLGELVGIRSTCLGRGSLQPLEVLRKAATS